MSYQEDIDNIFKLKNCLEDEVEFIDENNLYEYVLKNKSLGFLFSYLEILIEKEIPNYKIENRYRIEEYIITSLFDNLEKSLNLNLHNKCLLLKEKKEYNFMNGYNSCLAQKVFILSAQDSFYYWHYYIKKYLTKLSLKN
jgi:hypothetical protein